MNRRNRLLALLVAPFLVAAEGEDETLVVPARLDLPWGAPTELVGPTVTLEYFTSFTRPNRRVVMVGAPVPKDRLPLPPADCVCDDPHLACSITASGARVGWSGTASDWPMASGLAGRCRAEDVVFEVELALATTGAAPWWHGPTELVVPVTAARKADTKADVLTHFGVPGEALPTPPGDVTCRFDVATGRMTAVVKPTAALGTHPCLVWKDSKVDVRLVPAP